MNNHGHATERGCFTTQSRVYITKVTAFYEMVTKALAAKTPTELRRADEDI